MFEIPIILRFGGAHAQSRKIKKEVAKKLYKNAAGCLNGYCEAKIKPAGFKVWINSRQTDREMVDSFFHEMTHVLLKIRFARRNFRLTGYRAEALCAWIGYLAKAQFGDSIPKVFGRHMKRRPKK